MNTMLLAGALILGFAEAGICWYVTTKTKMVDLEAARMMRDSQGSTRNESLESSIRRAQSKMLNGGYHAYEVEFSRSNCDI